MSCAAVGRMAQMGMGMGMGGAHSNAGGGGERVLWTAIALMQRTKPDVISVVYSGDVGASKEQIIAKAKVRCLPRPSPRARSNVPALTTRRCCSNFGALLARPRHVDQVRYHACAAVAALCLPRVEMACRGSHVAAVHDDRAEPGLDVPRVGGAIQVRSGPLHRCVARCDSIPLCC